MNDRENFRALAAMFAMSKLAESVHTSEQLDQIAKDCVILADALLEQLEPQEGIIALKKRKPKNVPE
jgi:hypothetical protein